MTKNDVLLMAAQRLAKTFTAEDLTVMAWHISREKFGLDGFIESYPDVNKVLCQLMGKEGLVKKGKLIQIGRGATRRYKLP